MTACPKTQYLDRSAEQHCYSSSKLSRPSGSVLQLPDIAPGRHFVPHVMIEAFLISLRSTRGGSSVSSRKGLPSNAPAMLAVTA
jgi:hypothetical protein